MKWVIWKWIGLVWSWPEIQKIKPVNFQTVSGDQENQWYVKLGSRWVTVTDCVKMLIDYSWRLISGGSEPLEYIAKSESSFYQNSKWIFYETIISKSVSSCLNEYILSPSLERVIPGHSDKINVSTMHKWIKFYKFLQKINIFFSK